MSKTMKGEDYSNHIKKIFHVKQIDKFSDFIIKHKKRNNYIYIYTCKFKLEIKEYKFFGLI